MKQKMRELVRLTRKKNTLEAELSEVNSKLSGVQRDVLDLMEDAGMQNVKLDSGETVYLRRTIIPKAVDGDNERAYQALIDAGYPQLAKRTFHWKSVQGAILEMEQMGRELPDSFEGAIEVYEKYTPVVRDAGKEN